MQFYKSSLWSKLYKFVYKKYVGRWGKDKENKELTEMVCKEEWEKAIEIKLSRKI